VYSLRPFVLVLLLWAAGYVAWHGWGVMGTLTLVLVAVAGLIAFTKARGL
jgi:hypothetical protein